ncbi:MAG: G5 domain-containing protein [Clostridia bacterium]|nr:G5 domain-containing protein [Clostridia bacterium]
MNHQTFRQSGMARVFGRYLAILLAISTLIVLAVFAITYTDESTDPPVTTPATTVATTTAAPPQTTVATTTTAPLCSVTVWVDGEERILTTRAASVAEALAEAEISLGDADEVRPSETSDVYDGMYVTITRVEIREMIAEVELDFTTETEESDELYIGETELVTEGQKGLKRVIYAQTYRDGELIESRILSSEIIQDPVTRVLRIGTKVRPVTTKATTKVTTKTTTKKTTKATTAPTTAPIVSSEPEAITVSVNGKVYGVQEVINGEAVAYYSKLANPSTATGNPAIPGKTIAVDPKVIPLGSLVYITSVDGVSWTYGPAYAHDVGGGIKGNIVDLFKASYNECVAHGRRNCIIYVLEQ